MTRRVPFLIAVCAISAGCQNLSVPGSLNVQVLQLPDCSSEVHAAYEVLGPDGNSYPTWHPAVDPSGCTFGHEHGDDPSLGNVYDPSDPIAFGYVAAVHARNVGVPDSARREDHAGYKVNVGNDLDMREMRLRPDDPAPPSITCDAIFLMHQGTHSPDAFTNNLHEIDYILRCTDGIDFRVRQFVAFGAAGGFVARCNFQRVEVGPATNPRQLVYNTNRGRRILPTMGCLSRASPVREAPRLLNEQWESDVRILPVGVQGLGIVTADPYLNVRDPSRIYDEASRSLKRTLDLCYERQSPIYDSLECEAARANRVTVYDDPRSPFRGANRSGDINANEIRNADGPTIWFSDVFGMNARTTPFAGSIQQFIAAAEVTTASRGFRVNGPAISRKDFAYQGELVVNGVRPPN